MSESAIIRRRSIEPAMGTSPFVSARLGLFVALLLVVSIADNQLAGRSSGSKFADARYLPTRSDDSSVEVIREILKNILNEAAEQQEALASSSSGQPFVRTRRFFSTQNRAGPLRQHHLLSKSSNGNEQLDEMPLMLAAWQSARSPALTQRRPAGEPTASRSIRAESGSNRGYFRQQEADLGADG